MSAHWHVDGSGPCWLSNCPPAQVAEHHPKCGGLGERGRGGCICEQLARQDSALAELPRIARRHKELLQRKQLLEQQIAEEERQFKAQLRHVIVEHEDLGSMAISHMADGSVLYWIADPE